MLFMCMISLTVLSWDIHSGSYGSVNRGLTITREVYDVITDWMVR